MLGSCLSEQSTDIIVVSCDLYEDGYGRKEAKATYVSEKQKELRTVGGESWERTWAEWPRPVAAAAAGNGPPGLC